MASNSKKTETKRVRRQRGGGRKRKGQMERDGTTRTEAELFGSLLSRKSSS